MNFATLSLWDNQNTDPADAALVASPLLPPPGLSTFGGVGAPSFPIYRHGYSVRLALNVPKQAAEIALDRLGYTADNPVWVGKGATKTLRGTAWLTGRAPRTATLPLARFNRAHGMALYGLAVEERPDGYTLDVSGVRFDDVTKLCRKLMGLRSDHYSIGYYRRAEVYVVLAPQDAFLLAEALQGEPQNGRGRLARKFHLANVEIPMTIGKRTHTNASMRIYRIRNGATNAFKCEIALEGRRMDRSCFGEADVAKLTATLVDLVEAHGLHPLRKPSRWEPRAPEDLQFPAPFDANLAKLPQAAWRGQPVDSAIIRNCHSPIGLQLAVSACESGTYPGPARIRANRMDSKEERKEGKKDSTNSNQEDPSTSFTSYKDKDKGPKATKWTELANELATLQGALTEAVLAPDQDPKPLLDALLAVDPNTAVAILSADNDTWYSATEMAALHPGTEESRTMAIVVDPSIIGTVQHNAYRYDPETAAYLAGQDEYVCPDTGEVLAVLAPGFNVEPGPCCRHPNELVNGGWRSETRAVAAALSPMLRELRDQCERDGLNVVLVTVDCRPDHGRGELQRSHFFRDSRVRSLLGDAGRHWCHQRYLVDSNVTAWKDEAEGRPGRLVFQANPWGGHGYGRGRF